MILSFFRAILVVKLGFSLTIAMLEGNFAERNECFCQFDRMDERIECKLSFTNAVQYDPRVASLCSHPVFHVSPSDHLEFI